MTYTGPEKQGARREQRDARRTEDTCAFAPLFVTGAGAVKAGCSPSLGEECRKFIDGVLCRCTGVAYGPEEHVIHRLSPEAALPSAILLARVLVQMTMCLSLHLGHLQVTVQ